MRPEINTIWIDAKANYREQTQKIQSMFLDDISFTSESISQGTRKATNFLFQRNSKDVSGDSGISIIAVSCNMAAFAVIFNTVEDYLIGRRPGLKIMRGYAGTPTLTEFVLDNRPRTIETYCVAVKTSNYTRMFTFTPLEKSTSEMFILCMDFQMKYLAQVQAMIAAEADGYVPARDTVNKLNSRPTYKRSNGDHIATAKI